MRVRGARGFSLPEIMIALALGLTLLGAFLVVVQRCRASFSTNDSLARLEDNARHALSVLVPDIEPAGFFGFAQFAPVSIAGRLPPGIDACGSGFAMNITEPVQGSDGLFTLPGATRDCAPTATAGGARIGSDTLTVRHASQDAVASHAGRLQVYSQVLSVDAPLVFFADGSAPGPVDEAHVVRDREVRTYYIANNSVERPGWPALRVKALTESGGRAQFRDEEVLPGVEDLQVEFGVVRIDEGRARVHYVAPGSSTAPGDRIIAVRLWLRIRADVTEPGFEDARTQDYANVRFVPSPLESHQRRVLVERTIALRNVRP